MLKVVKTITIICSVMTLVKQQVNSKREIQHGKFNSSNSKKRY